MKDWYSFYCVECGHLNAYDREYCVLCGKRLDQTDLSKWT